MRVGVGFRQAAWGPEGPHDPYERRWGVVCLLPSNFLTRTGARHCTLLNMLLWG